MMPQFIGHSEQAFDPHVVHEQLKRLDEEIAGAHPLQSLGHLAVLGKCRVDVRSLDAADVGHAFAVANAEREGERHHPFVIEELVEDEAAFAQEPRRAIYNQCHTRRQIGQVGDQQ